MKRTIALLLVVMLLLTACGKPQPSEGGTTPGTVATTGSTEPSGTAATTETTVPTTDATEATTVPTEAPTTAPTEEPTEAATEPASKPTTGNKEESTKPPKATEPPTEPTKATEPTDGDSSSTGGTEETTEPTKPTEGTEPPEEEAKLTQKKTSLTLEVGNTSTLGYEYTGTGTLTWTSSNSAVASVSNGKVTAKSAGTATITLTDGKLKAECKVTVTPAPTEPAPTEPPVPSVGELTIKTPNRTVVYVGETLQIDYTYTGDKSALKFESDAPWWATVTNSGLVTGIEPGRVYIDVYHGDTLLGSLTLQVEEKPAETQPSYKAESIYSNGFTGPYFNGVSGVVGNYMTFIAVAKTSGDNQVVTATSSNSGVATVSLVSTSNDNVCTFKVSFVGTGSTTITITSEDGYASISYTLNVKGGYSSAMGGQLTPEQFVACANGIMAENGANINTSMGYRVLTMTDAELTGSRARGYAEGWIREFWPKGIRSMGLSYQGVNEDGNHVFYIHC